jgi:hypothetical protein
MATTKVITHSPEDRLLTEDSIMKKHFQIAALVAVGFLANGISARGQQDVERAAAGEVRSPELEVLDWFVGSWEETVELKPAGWVPERTTITATGTRRWILNGTMVENRGVWSPAKDEFLHLTSYDPQRREYRQLYFDKNTTVPQEYRGTWDEATKTFTFKASLPDGVTGTSTQKFLDKDSFTWTLVAKEPSGKVMLDMQGKCVRKKE